MKKFIGIIILAFLLIFIPLTLISCGKRKEKEIILNY